jgi:hypothetical protein
MRHQAVGIAKCAAMIARHDGRWLGLGIDARRLLSGFQARRCLARHCGCGYGVDVGQPAHR